MSNDAPISSEAELNEALKRLLVRAHKGGIDVEGGWECRNGPEYPDWDVLVTAVEKRQD